MNRIIDVPRASFPAGWLSSDAPLEVDVGCHRGAFLVAMAGLYPASRFLGIERQAGRVERCLGKIDRLELRNAHAVQGESLAVLREAGLAASAIHVSFPDPWPKRRHRTRRLVNGEFLRDAWRSIARGGKLRLMTDQESYFRAMKEAAAGFDGFEAVDWEDGREYPPTQFQRKFESIPIYRLALRRCDSASSE